MCSESGSENDFLTVVVHVAVLPLGFSRFRRSPKMAILEGYHC